jgi:mono/diheme cytochrome c family protein
MLRGVSPEGRHYYPSFPYLSYQRKAMADVLDLKAFLDMLPAVAGDTPRHDLHLPLRLRRGLGLWKLLFMDGEPFAPDPAASAEVNRGAYLVTGPGHCGECHTPRNLLGGPEADRALAGVWAPSDKDRVPNITPGGALGDWSPNDIAAALATGILPDFETFGGSMIEVQENMAELTPEDRAAIAAYLKSLPPLPDAKRPSEPR